MWVLIQALLTGQVTDPVLIFFGSLGAFIILLAFGGFFGFVCAIVAAKIRPKAGGGVSLFPWIAGLVTAASMLASGVILLSPNALLGISSWAVSLSGGLGAAVGCWAGYSERFEKEPRIAIANPFVEGDEQPFGTTEEPPTDTQ